MEVSPKNLPKNSLFKINLLIHKGEHVKFPIKLLKWLLSSGRYIVILVEIIVISAFVYRYKLDGELAELQEQSKGQIQYLQSLKNNELLIRQVQFQLSTIKQTKQANPDLVQILLKIAKLTPKAITLTNISLNKTQNLSKLSLTISGNTPSNLELSAFLKALQKDPSFANIALGNISFEGQTIFTITGNLNEKGDSSS